MKRLTPVLKDYLWGGYKLKGMFGRDNGGKKISESWEVSVHPDGESMAGGETLAAYLAKNPGAVDPEGSPFPVLIKYIDAAQNLSVQVHPDDEYARRVEGDNGKTEMWYILSAEEGAGIYCGFRRDTSREEFLSCVADGTVEKLLNFIPVKAGDCHLIKAGTVHAIGAGCVICEVQQSSNVTYRVYDYNRRGADGKLRPLHVEKAVDVINFHAFRDETGTGLPEKIAGGEIRLLTKCNYFRCRELTLNGKFVGRNARSFTAVNVLEGEGMIDGEPFSAGDSFFIDCGEKYVLGGQAKILLTDENNPACYAGIDLGGTFIKCGIVTEEGKILVKDKIPTGKERDYREIAADMASLVKRLEKKAGVCVDAVGIGSPGTIDSRNGVIVYSNNIAWRNVPLCSEIEKRLHLPTYITNDANAAALGEHFCGAGKKYSSLILVTLGTGVGGGIVIDGRLFEGNKSAGAEIGHSVIRMGGEKCTCGRRGCFEAYASATALIRQTRRAMERHPESKMWEIAGTLDGVDGKTAFDGQRAGDPVACRVVKFYIRCLAEGICNLLNEFRPEAILLGGGVCGEGDNLLLPLKKEVDKRLFGGTDYAPFDLCTASLGNDAGLCGAARLAAVRSAEKGEKEGAGI